MSEEGSKGGREGGREGEREGGREHTWYCWYSATRSLMLLSASVNSISSMPSPVYLGKEGGREGGREGKR